jgi:ubiquinone biosynthesis protein
VTHFYRLVFIAYTLLRFGVDGIALGRVRQPWLRAIARVLALGRSYDEPRGARLRQALERLGPIFIKFGQVLSTRRDLLPASRTSSPGCRTACRRSTARRRARWSSFRC